MQRALLLRAVGALLLAVLLVSFALSFFREALYAPTFVTGWALASVTVVYALLWWSAPRKLAPFAKRVRRQLLLVFVLLVGFGFHIRLSSPLGWVETILFVLVLAVATSALVGAMLVLEDDETSVIEQRAGRWQLIHTSLVWSLLALGIFHGAFAHLHGYLAHALLYGGSAIQ